MTRETIKALPQTSLRYVLIYIFSRGSVIADVTVTYFYVNRDQVVRFLDGLDRTKKLINMPISSTDTNSTSSKNSVCQTRIIR